MLLLWKKRLKSSATTITKSTRSLIHVTTTSCFMIKSVFKASGRLDKKKKDLVNISAVPQGLLCRLYAYRSGESIISRPELKQGKDDTIPENTLPFYKESGGSSSKSISENFKVMYLFIYKWKNELNSLNNHDFIHKTLICAFRVFRSVQLVSRHIIAVLCMCCCRK